MKRLFTLALLATGLMTGISAHAQEDKSKRVSPPVHVQQELKKGTIVTIDYSQPSVKGRSIGKDLEPKDGQVWRTGANEATVFETNTDININGKPLPAGKYSMFTLFEGNTVTIIFNKTWSQWGAFKYNSADDQLRVQTKVGNSSVMAEKMTIDITPDGKVLLLWGGKKVVFTID
jgi:hypothetical protein